MSVAVSLTFVRPKSDSGLSAWVVWAQLSFFSLTFHKSLDLLQIRMLVSHIHHLDQPDLSGHIDAVVSPELGLRHVIFSSFDMIWNREASVWRRVSALELLSYSQSIAYFLQVQNPTFEADVTDSVTVAMLALLYEKVIATGTSVSFSEPQGLHGKRCLFNTL